MIASGMLADLLLTAVLLARVPDEVGFRLIALERADRVAHATKRGVAQVELANGRALDALLMKHGWPKRTELGAAATNAAFVVAMHARALPARQKAWLALLEAAAAQGEAEAIWVDLLRARVQGSSRTS